MVPRKSLAETLCVDLSTTPLSSTVNTDDCLPMALGRILRLQIGSDRSGDALIGFPICKSHRLYLPLLQVYSFLVSLFS